VGVLFLTHRYSVLHLQGVPENIAQSLFTTILQPYVTESCSLQQNVQKEIVYTIKASV